MSTILITGASRGIGRATALQFATVGNTLILVCKSNIDRLHELADLISSRGAKVLPIQADISDSAEVCRLFDIIKANGLSIDLLINNAGISYTGLLQDMTDNEWHTILDTNLSAMFYCCRAAIPMMLQHGGKIINISSIWGTHGASCEVAYSATKGAVNSFTKALAKELAPSNIQVNAVSFGFIDTDMNAKLSPEEIQDFADSYIPAGRIATAEEAAEFIATVATAGSYCTGQILGFDGGY